MVNAKHIVICRYICSYPFYVVYLLFALGTYGAATHLRTAADCTKCPSGKYCEREGLSTWTGDCDAGYFCVSGAKFKAPTDGTTGYICPTGLHE